MVDWRTGAEESFWSPRYHQLPGSRPQGPLKRFSSHLVASPGLNQDPRRPREFQVPWGKQLHSQMGPESEAGAGARSGRTSGEMGAPGEKDTEVGPGQAGSVQEAEHQPLHHDQREEQ